MTLRIALATAAGYLLAGGATARFLARNDPEGMPHGCAPASVLLWPLVWVYLFFQWLSWELFP